MDIFSFCTTQNFYRKSGLSAGFTLGAVVDTPDLKKIPDFTLASVPRNRHVLNLYFREICIFDHLSQHKSAAVASQVHKSMRYGVERLLGIVYQHISYTGDHRLTISRSIIQDFIHSNIR